ncbi:MAG: hypothetical protein PWP05_1271 [Thermovirga sp.]|jgi:NAD(P)H-nitrite reductase large subunit|nr:hypothetical protein [Thermovirga sp.]MDN5368556.1 hypothetical protein [Thermovirga sp.]
MDWKKAGKDEIVCYCQKVTKGEIVKAMYEGANTMEEVMKKTKAGIGGRCKELNPRGRCCHPDIEEIMSIYGETVKNLKKSSCCGPNCDCS